MDVVATHPYLEEELLIDATIRHPSSVKAVKAASEPAAAAIEGENEKFKRYPPTRGKRVVPAAMETWGRIGPHFMSLLLSLHAHGRRRDIAHGCPAGNYLNIVHAAISFVETPWFAFYEVGISFGGNFSGSFWVLA